MPVKRAKVWTEDPDLPKGYLSVSAVDTYLTCPYSFYLQYIEGIQRPLRSVELFEGSMGHEALEFEGTEKLKRGDEVPKKELLEFYGDNFSTQKDDANWKDSEDKPDDILERGQVHLAKYATHYARKFTPLPGGVEKKIETTIGGVPVIGYIDRIIEDDGQERIVDFKFTGKAKSLSDVEDGLQMGVYALAEGKRKVEMTCFTKTKDPEIKRVQGTRNDRSLEKTVNVFRSVSEAIKLGSFPYCSPDSWKCREKWCSVWHACPQGGKK